jgi:hypothetical protein
MVGNGGPVCGRLIGRIGPEEKHHQRQCDAAESEQGQNERCTTPAAKHESQREIGDERADEDDAEQGPAAVDVLHDEILLGSEVDLVEERK